MMKTILNRSMKWLWLSVAAIYLYLFPSYAHAAWNGKSLVTGVIDTISYICFAAWVFFLFNAAIRRRYVMFIALFFFGGMALALLNSNTQTTTIGILGGIWSALLNAQ